MLSVQKKLSLCPYGLHQSWAPFPASKYKRVVVSIVFLTSCNELLLKQDETGKFILPTEKFIIGNLLLGAPGRVIAKEFGVNPEMMLDVRSGRQIKVLGLQAKEGGDYDVLMTAPVLRLSYLQKRYKTYVELVSQAEEPDSSILVAAKAFGWQQSELATA